MVDVTASLDAATQQVLALLAQIRLSNVRFVQAQDVGAADACLFAPIPNVTSYGADLVLVADIAAPNATTAPRLAIQGLPSVPIQNADGSAPAVGTVAGKRMLGFSSLPGGGFAARLLGLAPADVSALLAAYITNNYIISSAVTKAIGPGGDFATLSAALTWVGQYRIAPTGAVQFVLPAGQTRITGQFLGINHPDGQRITIVGAPMTLAAPTAANFQVTGSSAAARANDRAANLAMCRGRYASEILLTGAAQIVVTSSFGGFRDLLISSDGTSNPGAGMLGDVLAVQNGITYATNCVFAGGAYRGVVSTGTAVILGSCFAFGNGGTGFSAEGGKIVGTTAAGSFGNGANGAFASNGGAFGMDQTVPNSNLTAQGNGANGCQASPSGIVPTLGPGAVLSNNGAYGAIAFARGTIVADGATAANNGAAGFATASGGYVSAINTSGAGNGSYGYNASGQGLVVATGGTASGASGTLSPAANTVGNGDAYIFQ